MSNTAENGQNNEKWPKNGQKEANNEAKKGITRDMGQKHAMSFTHDFLVIPLLYSNFNSIIFELPLDINPYVAVNILEASLFLTRPLSVDGLVQRMRVPVLVKTLIGVICNVIQCNVM